MAKYMNPAERFLRDLVAAYQAQLRRDAWDFWLERLKRWQLTEPTWRRALDLVIAGEQAMPPLATVYDYLRRAENEIRGPRDTKLQLFDGPDGRRYVRAVRIGKHEDGRDRYAVRRFAHGEEIPDLPDRCANEHVLVERPMDGRTDWESNPSAYPDGEPQGECFVLSERGREEVREIARAAWLEAGGDPAKFDAMHASAMRAIQGTRDRKLHSDFSHALEEPADYDDSDIAIGKQRLAQLERLEAWERQRQGDKPVTARNTSDQQAPSAPAAQEPADAWREF